VRPCASELERAARPRDGAGLGPGVVLGVRVVMMVMAMVVMAGRKYRAGKHQQKQDCCKNLFHATNVARSVRQE